MPKQSSTLRIALVGLFALALAMGIGRFAYTPILPLMRSDNLLDISGGGLLASIHFLGYLLGAMIAAKLPVSPKLILQSSLIAIGISTLAMGLTENFYFWAILRLVAGLCSAFTLVVVSNFFIKHLAEIGHPQKQGWIFSGVGAGIVIAGLGTLAVMVFGIGSAQTWQMFGIGSLVAAIVISMNLGPEVAGVPVSKLKAQSARGSLVWSIVFAYGAAGMGYSIPATYLPVMAREIIHSPLIFGWAWPVFGAAAFLSTLLAAMLQNRFSNRQIWAVAQIVMAIGVLLPILQSHILLIILAGICVGGTFMIITMMGLKEAHRLAPKDDVMRQIAAMTASFAAGQMIGPVFASTLHDYTNSFSASLMLTCILLMGTAAILLRRER